MLARATLSIWILSTFTVGGMKEGPSWTNVSGKEHMEPRFSTSSLSSIDNFSSTSTASNLSSSDVAQRLSQAHFEFTLKLYRALVQIGGPTSNMAFSPILVSTLLTPTLLSAKEYALSLMNMTGKHVTTPATDGWRTEKEPVSQSSEPVARKVLLMAHQIQQALNFNELNTSSVEAWHKATVASLTDKYYKKFLRAPRGFLLLQRGFLTKELKKIFRKWFGPAIKEVQGPLTSFKVLSELNRWTESQTNNKIRNFFHRNSVNERSSLLVSPAALDTFWLNEFNPNNTFQKGLFYLTPDERFEIPMMINRLELPLGYSQSLEARVLELPFYIRRASLFIILPDHPGHSLESNVTSENIRSLLSTLKTEVVNLRIPKFYIDTTLSLASVLRLIGIKDLFRTNAQNGRRRLPDPEFRFDDFIHRIRFDFHEGLEDIQASQPVLPTPETSSASRTDQELGRFGEKYFEVDHPFTFFLWDYIASTVICMGRVVDPRMNGQSEIDDLVNPGTVTQRRFERNVPTAEEEVPIPSQKTKLYNVGDGSNYIPTDYRTTEVKCRNEANCKLD